MFQFAPLEYWNMSGRLGSAGLLRSSQKCLVHLKEVKWLINCVFMFLFDSQAWLVYSSDWFTWMFLGLHYCVINLYSQMALFPHGCCLENYTQFHHGGICNGWKSWGRCSPSALNRTRSEVSFHLEQEEIIQSHSIDVQLPVCKTHSLV